MKKTMSVLLALILVFCLIACGNTGVSETTGAVETSAPEATEGAAKTAFTFIVVDASGAETTFELTTDKETVGDALLEMGLIVGEEGPYGLFVKTVNGITADYDADGTYWSFYIDGEYAMTGVDCTDVTEGATYTFKVEGGA